MSNKPGDWWNENLNPWQGCTPVSEACDHCWALAFLRRFHCQQPGEIRYYPERLKKLETWRKPRHIFVCSLSDVFHADAESSDEKSLVADTLLAAMVHYRHHTFYLLTKRPQNAPRIHKWWPNVRVGITVENQARHDERWPHLQATNAAFKFLHLEPLLGPVDLSESIEHVQWVVVGGENGPRARPMHPGWVRAIRDQCIENGTSFWFKGWGKWSPIHGTGVPHTEDDEEYPFCWVTLDAKKLDSGCGPDACMISQGHIRDLDGREWSERP